MPSQMVLKTEQLRYLSISHNMLKIIVGYILMRKAKVTILKCKFISTWIENITLILLFQQWITKRTQTSSLPLTTTNSMANLIKDSGPSSSADQDAWDRKAKKPQKGSITQMELYTATHKILYIFQKRKTERLKLMTNKLLWFFPVVLPRTDGMFQR